MTHVTHTLKHTTETLSLLQLTDTHLFSNTDGVLLGVTTQTTFDEVLAQVIKTHPDLDGILFTGDIAQNPSADVYNRFKKQVDAIDLPYYCLAGNHDDPKLLSETFAGSDYHQVLHTKHWDFILLNSHFGKSPAGFLSKESLQWLEKALVENHNKHMAIVLHHHPVPMDSEWIDNHMLKDAPEFWAVLEKFDHVKVVFFGHVHQDFTSTHKGVKLFASPATSAQFTPHSTDFSVDEIAAGYRWFKFFSDGDLETEVERLHYVPQSLNLNSKGY